jgi:hypothetical protein
MNSLALQPGRDPFPGVFVSVQGFFGFAMSREEFRDPGVPRSAVDDGHSPILLRLHLGAQDFCLYGVVRIVGPKPGGFVALLSVGIEILDVPIWRAVFMIKLGHNHRCYFSASSAGNALHFG